MVCAFGADSKDPKFRENLIELVLEGHRIAQIHDPAPKAPTIPRRRRNFFYNRAQKSIIKSS